jgi:hypothetical protein
MIDLPDIKSQERFIEACELGVRSETLGSYSEAWPVPTKDEVRVLIKMANLTGSQVGDMVGVNGRTVRKWTGGERNIPFSAWAILADAAGIKMIWL